MIRRIPSGRWIVVFSAAAGLFLFVYELLNASGLFRSFVEGATTTFAAMIVGGSGQRLWAGAQVERAEAPGGWGVRFARATRRPLRILVDRIDSQVTTLNDRLFAVEKDIAWLKEWATRPESEE